MDKDIIGDALDIGLESEAVVVMPKSPVVRSDDVPNPTMNDIVSDFSYARHNIHNAMEKSGALLESAMIAVAESGGSPRSIEVAAMLLNQVGATSKDLLNLAKLAQDLTVPNDSDENSSKVSMTAAKLSELLDEQQKDG